jgi:hypothetical protein
MKNITYSILIFFVLLTSGCESLVTNVDMPKVDRKLVLISFISPSDSIVSVRLTETMPIYGEPIKTDDDIVTNAEVFITDGTQTATLVFNPESKAYEISTNTFSIQAGKTYTLTSTSAGRKATAMCTVPQATVTEATITLDSLGPTSQWSNRTRWALQAEWQHVPGASYYKVVGMKHDISYSFNGDSSAYRSDLFYNNNLIDVQKKSQERYSVKNEDIHLGRLDILNGRPWGSKTTSISIHILVTDHTYFQYHDALSRYYGNDPFTEPTRLYTNVEGGLGVFAAYTSYHKEYTF